MSQQVFIKIVDAYYLGVKGLEGVILRGEALGDARPDRSVFVYPENIKPFMREDLHYLIDGLDDAPGNPYLFAIIGGRDTFATCEVVDNPFAHWNALKSGNLH